MGPTVFLIPAQKGIGKFSRRILGSLLASARFSLLESNLILSCNKLILWFGELVVNLSSADRNRFHANKCDKLFWMSAISRRHDIRNRL